MDRNIFKLVFKALGFAFVVIVISYYGLGSLLVAMFGYPPADASYHLPTYTLLAGLIFTVILCTLIILEKLKNR